MKPSTFFMLACSVDLLISFVASHYQCLTVMERFVSCTEMKLPHFEMLLLDGEESILPLLLPTGSMVLPSNSTWRWSGHVPTSCHTFSEASDVGFWLPFLFTYIMFFLVQYKPISSKSEVVVCWFMWISVKLTACLCSVCKCTDTRAHTCALLSLFLHGVLVQPCWNVR